jgi:hypothetical protein
MVSNKPQEKPLLPLWPEVGKDILGLGKDATYSAAKKKQIPTIRLANKLFVPRAWIEQLGNVQGTASAAADEGHAAAWARRPPSYRPCALTRAQCGRHGPGIAGGSRSLATAVTAARASPSSTSIPCSRSSVRRVAHHVRTSAEGWVAKSPRKTLVNRTGKVVVIL